MNGLSEPMTWEEADDEIIKVKQYRDVFSYYEYDQMDIVQADRMLTGAATAPLAFATSSSTHLLTTRCATCITRMM